MLGSIRQAPAFTPADKRREFDRLTENYDHFSDIRLFDIRGFEMTLETDAKIGRKDPSESFENAVRGEIVISNPYIPAEAARKGDSEIRLVITVWLPIAEPGQAPTSVVRADFDFAEIWSVIDTAKIGGETGAFLMLDKDGNFLAHPKRSLIFNAKFLPAIVQPNGGGTQSSSLQAGVAGRGAHEQTARISGRHGGLDGAT